MTTKLTSLFFILSASLAMAQQNYGFMSTGQQLLLINPAFCAASQGLNVQTLFQIHKSGYFNTTPFVNYTGATYRFKNFGFGLSNTFFSEKFNDVSGQEKYHSNKTDLSLAYAVKLGNTITLLPSLQGSVYKATVTENMRQSYSGSATTLTGGLIVDINKRLTFGAAFYNLAGHATNSTLNLSSVYLTQVYHVSLLLFKDKNVNLQPYAIARFDQYSGSSFELGAYTSFGPLSVHTAIRSDNNIDDIQLIAGVNANLGRIKFGYTFAHGIGETHLNSGSYHELFVSVCPFNRYKERQYSLMIN